MPIHSLLNGYYNGILHRVQSQVVHLYLYPHRTWNTIRLKSDRFPVVTLYLKRVNTNYDKPTKTLLFSLKMPN